MITSVRLNYYIYMEVGCDWMKNVPQISDTEWLVMKAIWTKSPLTANQIVESLAGKVTCKPKTVKTLIGRLVNKKAVGFHVVDRVYQYYPLVLEEDCVNAESSSFLRRVYDGALNAMFVNFLKQEDISREEIEELKRILDKKNS
jgi:BlaI family transcriptional regulator, penicillinase repressor